MKDQTRSMILAGTAAILLSATPAMAQVKWSSSAITGMLHIGPVNTVTCDIGCIHGRGVRLAPGFIGTAYIYLPVNLPNLTPISWLRLRAEDNHPDAVVRADLFRQPNSFPVGGAELVTTVATANLAGDGFQFVMSPFLVHAIATNTHSYYVRITIKRGAAAAAAACQPTAYDVSLH